VTGESSPGEDVPINTGAIGSVGTGISPTGPSRELSTAVPLSSTPRIRQDVEPVGCLCIGQAPSVPCGHVHASWSATQNAAGATISGAIWQTSQAVITGPSAQRRRVIDQSS
jgi:hypothetical protein